MSLLIYLASVERLALDVSALPEDMARALSEDMEYARFGAALPDLPSYAGLRGGLAAVRALDDDPPPFARLFHSDRQVAMGLKMAELVATGALVGRTVGLAFVCGYFTHICLARVLVPLVERLLPIHQQSDEAPHEAAHRIAWTQALFFIRDAYGKPMVGQRALRPHLQLLKRQGPPTRGVGRGIYELIRLSSDDAFQKAPKKAEVDSWVRGLYVYARALSSPIGRLRDLPSSSNLSYRELYLGPDVDVPGEVHKGIAHAHLVLARLSAWMRRGSFTPRARARFLQDFPELATGTCAA